MGRLTGISTREKYQHDWSSFAVGFVTMCLPRALANGIGCELSSCGPGTTMSGLDLDKV